MLGRRKSVQLAGLTEDLSDLIAKGPAVVSAIADVVRRVSPYLGTVQNVVRDPAFPAVMDRVNIIQSFAPSAPLIATPGVPITNGAFGVGLNKLIMPLDAYIYVKQNPWAPYAALAGIIAVIGGIGYHLGKRKALAK